MDHPVFTGSSAALVTPFAADGPDLSVLDKLIQLHLDSGTAAITVCGTTGEASTMTARERRAVMERAVDTVNGRIPVIAGAGSNDTKTAVESALDAQRAGADAVLAVTPYYNKTTQEGLIAHYMRMADRLEIPLILYNVPARTGMTIGIETYEALSRHPNIAGTKEASGNVRLVSEILARCRKGFTVWSGSDSDATAFLALGAQGVISVAANVVPLAMAELTSFALSGDYPSAAGIQRKLLTLDALLASEVNPIPVKAALELMGYDVGLPRLPLVPCSPGLRLRLYLALRELGAIRQIRK